MAERYRVFASYLLFKEVTGDALGRLYRAGEFGPGGVRRLAWLRIFEGPLADRASLTSSFARAARIADQVHSTNIAAGVEHLSVESTAALAHEYVASQPLSIVFERAASEDFPIPIDNALLITEKIALALSAALTTEVDGERVVHGLVHPALTFVTYDGECVLAGFGVGEHLLGALQEDDAPEIGRYLAPEVIESKTPSRRGDVYSLGAILFQLLTGSPLPTDPEERPQAVSTATIAGDEQPLPDDIRALLGRSLAARAQERFSSASDFKKELDRLLYGGSYSPTTFNLALFMDRLFRTEAEADERDVVAERAIDVEEYLAPPVEGPPLELDDEAEAPRSDHGTRLVLAGGAVVVAVAIAAAVVLMRGGLNQSAPPEPTPTALDLAVQRRAQEDRMRELAEGLVREMMAEKEAEIRTELQQRQAKIDELQRRLQASEQEARQGRLSREEEQRRQDLRRQIAAEEEAQRQRQADLEAERQRADLAAREQARNEIATMEPAATDAGGEAAAAAAAGIVPDPAAAAGTEVVPAAGRQTDPQPPATPTLLPQPSPTAPTLPTPTSPPLPTPTAVPEPSPGAASAAVEFNSFVDPTEVDSLPVIIKDHPPDWSQIAIRSRRRGVIIIQATVSGAGEVTDVKLLRADDSGFGIPDAALAAARKYRFKPATKDGVAVSSHATITVPYRFAPIR